MFYKYIFVFCHVIAVVSCVADVPYFLSSPPCANNNNEPVENVCQETFATTAGDERFPFLSCLLDCNNDTTCIGVRKVERHETKMCFLYKECLDELTWCKEGGEIGRYYSKRCAHDGRWTPFENRCKCVNGWVGEQCKDIAKSPTDLITSEYATGQHRVYVDLNVSINKKHVILPMHVDILDTYPKTHSVTLLKTAGIFSFNVSYVKYRKGFRFNDDNFWLGLDRWAALSAMGYSKLVLMMELGDMEPLIRVYEGFAIQGAQFGFRFDYVSSVSLSKQYVFVDCFYSSVNVSFSAFDKSFGGKEDRCAATVGFGWWFGEHCKKAPCSVFGWGQQQPAPWSNETTTNVVPERMYIKGVPIDSYKELSPCISITLKQPTQMATG